MENNTATETETLPKSVLATWKAEDWDDQSMTANCYRYYRLDEATGLAAEEIELTENEATRYAWGQADDTSAGGCQRGDLR